MFVINSVADFCCKANFEFPHVCYTVMNLVICEMPCDPIVINPHNHIFKISTITIIIV